MFTFIFALIILILMLTLLATITVLLWLTLFPIVLASTIGAVLVRTVKKLINRMG